MWPSWPLRPVRIWARGGLALKVGLVGKLCVFTLTAPMLISLLEMILELTHESKDRMLAAVLAACCCLPPRWPRR